MIHFRISNKTNISITFDGKPLLQTDSTKFLWLLMDSNINFTDHSVSLNITVFVVVEEQLYSINTNNLYKVNISI